MIIQKLKAIVEQASALAIRSYGKVEGYLKPDGSWGTQADQAVETFLRSELHQLFDAYIYGEEQGWSGLSDADYCVVIDPIDGTALYREGLPLWGVSVAVFYKQQPFFGIFDMPASGHCYAASVQAGATHNGKQLVLKPAALTELSAIGVSSDVHHWDLQRFPGKLRAYGVSGYDVCRVAGGTLIAALLTRFYFYDIAAGYIVLKLAGGELFHLSGEPVPMRTLLDMSKPKAPVIACHADVFPAVRACFVMR